MSKRPEDLTDDELRVLCSDLADRIEALDDESEEVPDSLLDQFSTANSERGRRDALAARKAGRYSATLNVEGEEREFELRATTHEAAEAEAQSGADAMNSVSGATVTVTRLNAPISEGE